MTALLVAIIASVTFGALVVGSGLSISSSSNNASVSGMVQASTTVVIQTIDLTNTRPLRLPK